MDIVKAIQPSEPFDEEMEGQYEVELPVEGAQEEQLEQQPSPHSENLAMVLDESDLNSISNDLMEAYAADLTTRTDWLNAYTKGLDLLGFKMEDRTKPFKGASGVFHPLLSEAVVRFQSNAIVEIFPAAGPVLTKVVGDESDEKIKQSKRIKEELNYQLTENMCEFRPEMEKLLFRLPLAGSVFKKVYFDPMSGKPCSMMVPAEDFVIDYNSSDINSSERYTHVMKRSKNKLLKMMRSGFYKQIDLSDPPVEQQEGKEKEDALTGRTPSYKENSYTILEFYVNYNLPGALSDPMGIGDPYVITIEKSSSKVLSIYRNWKEGDQQREPDQYFVHYEYMPGLGFYGFGLIHLMGSIAKASTSILRQLIDAGTFSNLPGGLKTRGLRTKGMDEPIQPGEWRDVDVPSGNISDNLFPLPYKEPSSVLVALLQNLVEEGRRIGSIADVEIGSSQANAPVGTTLALMERSLKVMSAVHARLHASLKTELKMIAKIIGEFMPPQYDWDDQQQFNRAQDFDARVDVFPVSDPNAATQAQRIVQLQAVMQLAQQNPELYNLKELHRAGLQAIGIKNDERILPLDTPPPRLDPVSENMNLLTSQPVKVYPDQDHAAHLQVHVSNMLDPKIMQMVGQSPNAQKLMGAMEAHIAEHLAHQYRAEIEEELGTQLPPLGEELPPEVEARLSRLVAQAAVQLREAHKAEVERQAIEEEANDPVFQLREREVAVKEQLAQQNMVKSNQDFIVKIAQAVSKEIIDQRRIESEEMRAGMKIGADLTTFGATLTSEERREGMKMGKEIATDLRDSMMSREEMEREFEEREKDRINQLDIARSRPKPTGGK